MPSLTSLANPSRFMALSARALPWIAAVTALLFALGLWLAFTAPEDYQQGETVRIMYLHVPSAWLSLLIYTVMSVSAIGALVWRHPLAEVSMKAAAPIGCVFTFLCLVTGALWGKPMWGAWWVWDARLTSVLVLLLIYLGILAIWNAIEDQAHAARMAALATLVGFVNIPIVKFSVEWWNTLHQGASVFTLEGSKIAPEILLPLLMMACAFTCLYVALHLAAMRNEILRRRLRRLAILAASETPTPARVSSLEGGARA
ncbi:MAG: heme ABC transporter permease [Hyphomicrobiales bacterium]|nr:heme ABC transporter permease [Hyphomicrobiales bacterium]